MRFTCAGPLISGDPKDDKVTNWRKTAQFLALDFVHLISLESWDEEQRKSVANER
jgi:hypothetical protein